MAITTTKAGSVTNRSCPHFEVTEGGAVACFLIIPNCRKSRSDLKVSRLEKSYIPLDIESIKYHAVVLMTS